MVILRSSSARCQNGVAHPVLMMNNSQSIVNVLKRFDGISRPKMVDWRHGRKRLAQLGQVFHHDVTPNESGYNWNRPLLELPPVFALN